MNILYNNNPLTLPQKNMTVAELAQWKNLPQAGVAIAINDKMIKKDLWSVTQISQDDRIIVITAAFGG